jgi:ribonucleoside-diphosphate reductase alpha chain
MTGNEKVYEYSDALEQSIKYFGGEELPASVFIDKYALRDSNNNLLESTPEQMFNRIAFEIHRIEKNKFKNPLSKEEILEYIKDFKRIVLQGSPMYGIGNPYQYTTVSNCYVVESPLDSYSSICKSDEEIVQISKRRGGTGLDLSNLRPNGSSTTNAARTSTGVIPFAERYSNSIREVGQSGRRGALLLSLSVHHPEVVEFAKCKKELNKVTGANISIRLTDEFLNAVKNNTTYEQRFPVVFKAGEKRTSKMVDARGVWSKIIENAWATAEPGLLFWDRIISESPADCYSGMGFMTISTNPCSELPLCSYDSCRLLVLNLFTYVKNPFTKDAYFDFDFFNNDAQIAQRFMDDIIDIELEKIDLIIKKIQNDPEPKDVKKNELELWKKIKIKCEQGRRTGTGVTALGDALAALDIKYGSEKSIDIVDKIYCSLKLSCYKSSVEIAKELGPFPIWNSELEKNNPFLLRIKDEDPQLYADMNKYGRRNIALLTSAPAGSISTLTQTTSGIEPCYQISYKRRKKINPGDEGTRVDYIDKTGDSWQEFQILHPKVKEWIKISGESDVMKSPWQNCCAEDLDWHKRVILQATATKHIDHAIASTINLPEDVSVKDVAKIYESAWKEGVKGITVYRKNCRSGVLIDNTSEEKKLLIQKTTAPKRPIILPADIYHAVSKGEEYFALVGIIGTEDPYEIFAGKNGDIKKSIKKGMIKKIARGKYSLLAENGEIIQEDISKYINEDQEAITRLISSSLRHGCDVSFIVHQLEKVKGDLMSFSKIIARILKKYIPDNTRVHGEICKECGGQLIRQQGCCTCSSCSWSKCS